MTEIFDRLSVIGDPVEEEDRDFNMSVTSLEANPNAPTMDVVTERLLQDRGASGLTREKVMITFKRNSKSVKCYHCDKMGHVKRNCCLLSSEEKKFRPNHHKEKENKLDCSSDSENDALMICHMVLQANRLWTWGLPVIIMCSDNKLFETFQSLEHLIDVSLGDGRTLKALRTGGEYVCTTF